MEETNCKLTGLSYLLILQLLYLIKYKKVYNITYESLVKSRKFFAGNRLVWLTAEIPLKRTVTCMAKKYGIEITHCILFSQYGQKQKGPLSGAQGPVGKAIR
ncbi:MAG: hypothetical protein WD355_01705, partial [Balneolaceae bacterium]